MIMFRFIRLILFCFAIPLCSVKSEIITKCCPTAWNLLIKENSLVFCETASKENQTTFDAYNIEYVNHSSIPQCQYSVRKLFKNNEKFTQINGCVDRTANGDSFAVSCDSEPVIEVHELNRCCGSGRFYDYSERKCASNFGLHLNLKRFFNDEVILFKTQVPDCGPNEVFVEYVSTKHEIKFINHDLFIFDEILEPKSFCVEGLAKISPNEMIADHMIVRSCRPKTICERIPCIQRCCKTDQIIMPPGYCADHPQKVNIAPVLHDIKFPITDDDQQPIESYVLELGVFHSSLSRCDGEIAPLSSEEQYYFHKNGSLYLGPFNYDHDGYCIEIAHLRHSDKINWIIEPRIFVCLGTENLAKYKYYPVGFIISCVFLALTLGIYLALPNLLNIHGKTLVCYVMSCLMAFSILTYLHIKESNVIENEPTPMCLQLALMLVYSYTAVFCWQTVMCVDIWLTFGCFRSTRVLRQSKRESRKFLYYSAYAWGFPFLWAFFTLYAFIYEPFPEGWNPRFGLTGCFFSSKLQPKEHFLYFMLPAGMHVFINSVLFIMTAIYCSRVKREIYRMQIEFHETSASTKRKRFLVSKATFVFIMNFKLFTVMGISWILEILSTFTDNSAMEIIQDLYNIFLGLSIFVIFVFKKRVYREFKSRWGIRLHVRGSETRGSTTTTHTITMKDLSRKSTNDLPLLAASAALNNSNINTINKN